MTTHPSRLSRVNRVHPWTTYLVLASGEPKAGTRQRTGCYSNRFDLLKKKSCDNIDASFSGNWTQKRIAISCGWTDWVLSTSWWFAYDLPRTDPAWNKNFWVSYCKHCQTFSSRFSEIIHQQSLTKCMGSSLLTVGFCVARWLCAGWGAACCRTWLRSRLKRTSFEDSCAEKDSEHYCVWTERCKDALSRKSGTESQSGIGKLASCVDLKRTICKLQ